MKPKILCAFVISLFCIVSCTNIHEDGILPEDYSWAYGFWEVTEVEGSDVSHFYVYIGSDYIRIDEPYKRIASSLMVDDDFYPIYTFPKIEYSIDNESSHGDDELVLHYDGAWGYEEFLYLNKKSKTVSQSGEEWLKFLKDNGRERSETSKKYKMEVDRNVISEYRDAIGSSQIWYDWKKQNSNEKLSLRYQNMPYVILTKNGVTFDLGGTEYKFNPKKNTLELKCSDTDGGFVTKIYRRDLRYY